MQKTLLIGLLATYLIACTQTSKKTSDDREPASAAGKILLEMNFTYWPYELEGCMNTRDQFLEKTSRLKPKYTSDNGAKCHVTTGEWKDFFTGKTFKRAEDMIVAPVIPLQHIMRKGGKKWPFEKLHSFAHDEYYLIVFAKSSSGQTNGEDIYLKNVRFIQEAGIPKIQPQRCELAGIWKRAKDVWGIKYSIWGDANLRKIKEVLNDCANNNYERDFFRHWARPDGYQCDARKEVLMRDSRRKTSNKWKVVARDLPEVLSEYENDKLKIKKLKEDRCVVPVEGNWKGLYSGETYNKSVDLVAVRSEGADGEVVKVKTGKQYLDVDHVVPLKHAYITGGWKWPAWKKKLYANYMVDRNHLLAVSFSENRSKGFKDPSEYMPSNNENEYQCTYIETWLGIKWRWGLKVLPNESKAIYKKLEDCEGIIRVGKSDFNTKKLKYILGILESIEN